MVLAGFFSGKLKPHDCNEEHNAVWGCFDPVKKPRWNLPCWICFGKKGNTKCEVCGGHGAVGQLRCPNSVNTGTMDKLFSFYTLFVNQNVLPFGTCVLDQTRYFYNVINVFPSYELAWDRVEEARKKFLDNLQKKRLSKGGPDGQRRTRN